MKTRFLFFLYFFPPAAGTAPQRNFRIAKAIALHAAKSILYTASLPYGQRSEDTDLEIREIAAFDYRHRLRKTTADGYLPEKVKQSFITKLGIKLINTFPINVIVGEGGWKYIQTLIKEGDKSITKNKVTHIYSSFRPFADHYAAFQLKKRHPSIYWIADFRDLLLDPLTPHLLFKKAEEKRFKKIIRRADMLTTVSDGLAQHLRKYHTNVVVVRNAVTTDKETFTPVFTRYFHIVYTGSLYIDQRNPGPLFTALQELLKEGLVDGKKIRVIYAGKDGQQWMEAASAFQLHDITENKGIISPKESRQLQQFAGINVLLSKSTSDLQGNLTGKLVDYLEAGSPVMGIIAQQIDPEIEFILQETNIGECFSDNPAHVPLIKEFILNEYTHWLRNGMNRKPVNAKVLTEKYSVENVMKEMLKTAGVIK